VIERRLQRLIKAGLEAVGPEMGLTDLPDEIELSRPKQASFGDFSTNIAMILAARLERDPRDIATALVEALPHESFVERVEIAGPGFINLFVSDEWLHDVVRAIAEQREEFGRVPSHGRSVQVEFLSANPTGPLHVGHARNMVLGDAISRLLDATGWRVEREYYFNDAGHQMELFGASVEARYLQLLGRSAEVPEDGYHGEYLVDVVRDIVREHGEALADFPDHERRERLLHEGTRRVLDGIKRTLERFDVHFDVFFSEASLHASGEIDLAVSLLRERGLAYDHEGAVWFRSTEFGDDKDRPLIRSNGQPTYFAADSAYLIDKFRRVFDHLIYVWGADHHGNVKRVRGTAEALGYDTDAVEFVLYQFVSLSRGGEAIKMSKRSGTIVTLDELADEVGTDATKFTLLSQSSGQSIDFDIEVVKRQSMDNPVYYVQYGHARIASILRTADERGIGLRPIETADLALLRHESELALLRELAGFPELVRSAAELRAPYKLTHATQELAARFHRFYADCRVLSEDEELTQARLWLARATKQVLFNTLSLLGVSAPDSMERIDE
jgi:arginyl-tRNA synthetase